MKPLLSIILLAGSCFFEPNTSATGLRPDFTPSLYPLIGPAFEMDDPVPAPAIGYQRNPAAAVCGDVVLVVWQDIVWEQNSATVNAERFDLNGNLLDSAPVFVGTNNPSSALTIAANSNGFLIVWSQPASEAAGVLAARVSPEGILQDSVPIRISSAPMSRMAIAAAGITGQFLVVWSDDRSNRAEVYAARVNDAGSMLDPGGFKISGSRGPAFEPDVTSLGDEYFVVWPERQSPDGPDLFGTRISSDGSVLPAGGFLISEATGASEPSVAAVGGVLMAIWRWRDFTTFPGPAVMIGRQFQPTGAFLGSTFLISTNDPAPRRANLAAGQSSFLVVWQTDTLGRKVWAASISLEASLTSPALIWHDFWGPYPLDIVVIQDRFWVILPADFEDEDALALEVNAQGNRTDLDPIMITRSTNRARAPVVAWNGEVYLVVWQDNRGFDAGDDIYGVRLARDGRIVEPGVFPICTAEDHQYSPAVAACGPEFLVVWTHQRFHLPGSANQHDIYGTIVETSGAVRNPLGFPISSAASTQRAPAITASSNQFLVVWRDDRNSLPSDIYGARITRNGMVLDPNGLLICRAVGQQAAPSVASDGTNFLAVWRDERNGDEDPDIFGALLRASGAVGAEIQICTLAGHQRAPEVASDGSQYLVAWRDTRMGVSDLYGARITTSGAVIESNGFPIRTGQTWKFEPSVVAGEGYFLVGWQQATSPSDLSQIAALKVTSDGTVLPASEFSLGTQWYDSDILVMARGQTGDFVVVGEAVKNNVERVLAQFVTFNSLPELRIEPGPERLVSWPAWAAGFRLMQAHQLPGPFSQAPAQLGSGRNRISAEMSTEAPARFYRLERSP